MFYGYYTLNLEFNKALTGLPDVKTSDHKSRGLDITILNNGVVQNTTGMKLLCSAVIKGVTPNRTVTQEAELEDANTGHYMLTFPDSMINTVGEVDIELTLIDGPQTLSTNTGTMNVVEAVTSYENMEDDPNYPAFLKAMNELNTMQVKINDMQNQINTMSSQEHFQTGMIVMSPTPLNTKYWLPLDGTIMDLTNYPALADIYLNGLPNLSGRTAVALDGTQSEFNEINKMGGEKMHTLSVAEMPSHIHNLNMYKSAEENNGHYCAIFAGYGGNLGFQDRLMVYSGTNYWNQQPDANSAEYIKATGGGSAHNNLQPYCVVGKFYIHI